MSGSFQVEVEKGRSVTFDVQLYQSDETTEDTVASTDLIRFKMGRRAGTPDIELESTTDTTQVTFTAATNNVTITLDAADTSSLTAGPYSAEVLVIDESDGDEPKTYEQGVIQVLETLGGSVADV